MARMKPGGGQLVIMERKLLELIASKCPGLERLGPHLAASLLRSLCAASVTS
jgi:hypothetical protein